ncbi:class I SAM-dependent methyltransferase [Amycolatopsis nigrescens]|uniref:class I SAM-dependent methyltransferase n=1 Tax=Amycolatopsis nigrescens TaxID=381445 RepID=UPI0003746F16|nr:class I SAM-dependent methyltransferase [Amycolatopsis nigrescens]
MNTAQLSETGGDGELPDLPDLRQAVAALFDRSSETYDAVDVEFFPVFARQLLADVRLVPGERVLDVGCGRGAVLFAAAEQVGAEGTVTGIDLSPRMVERTARDIRQRGLTGVAVAVMDAQEPSLPGGFDAVLASAVVFFLPDPLAGLRAWHDLLVPGGRLGVTTFGGNDPRWAGVEEVFRPFVPPAMIWAMVNPASPFASVENFEAASAAVGFADMSSVVREHPITFRDPEQWIRWSWSHGQRVFWELVPAEHREHVRAGVTAALDRLRGDDGSIVMIQTVRYTVASRAPA